MKVELELRPLKGFPRLEGAHALAWSYLLDAIFADAHRVSLATLRVVLPSTELEPEVALRAELSGRPAQRSGLSVAFLGHPWDPEEVSAVQRVYSVAYGPLALRVLRLQRPSAPRGWHASDARYVLTARAKVLGALFRLYSELRHVHLADRTGFAMRRHFTSTMATPAFYDLRIWEPLEPAATRR